MGILDDLLRLFMKSRPREGAPPTKPVGTRPSTSPIRTPPPAPSTTGTANRGPTAPPFAPPRKPAATKPTSGTTPTPPPAAPPPPPAAPPPNVQIRTAPAGYLLSLGCHDASVGTDLCVAYRKEVEAVTRVPLSQVQPGLDRIEIRAMPPTPGGAMSVKEVQAALQALGLFIGGRIDGIYGYRTQSAIRLFQEYVRTMEKLDCLPDGRFGPQTQGHLQRWMASGAKPDWRPIEGEHAAWLSLLEDVKRKRIAEPGRVLEKVNAFSAATDTLKVADWRFDPDEVHLIGVRRNEMSGKFDDVFILLINGMVFKFQGSTEPGGSSNALGPPHLTPGQHRYHFGWHQRTYLALRPLGKGVLIIRAGADRKLDDGDLDRGLEANATINIHWGGRGMARDVNNWSEGCQVINGEIYINAAGQLIKCDAFAATSPSEAKTVTSKTRGAYNVLLDLVTALSGDLSRGTVNYTLLTEADVAISPRIAKELADARERVMKLV